MAETKLKKEVRPIFEKDWKKHYSIDTLNNLGFTRQKCKKCGRYFWANKKRDFCADSRCVGISFIGKKTKSYAYKETWKKIEKYFVDNGHTSIARYPVIPRWRDDLYFTNASIINFQPYVVNGQVKPPADPLIIPQTSIRFGDVSNVGVTGMHYTSFVMFGQHAFNSNKPYWKNEAIKYDFEYLTKVIGVKEKDLVFMEDVWEGGGYFGSSLEYYANGVELGNCVFMEFKDLGYGKYKKIKKPVIDMGAGLERLAWYTNGTPTSYDTTFKEVLTYLKKYTKIEFDNKLLNKYYKLAGSLNIDETKNLQKSKEDVAKKLGFTEEELFKKLEPVHALYSICDHTKTLLYTSTDGLLPSNSGGGYNLRILARRLFDINKKFNFNLDFNRIFEEQVKSLRGFDNSVINGLETAKAVIKEEERKYKLNKIKASSKLKNLLSRNKKITDKEFINMYKSDGITKEQIEEASKELNKKIEYPYNYLDLISSKDKKEKPKKDFVINLLKNENISIIKSLPNTDKLYYNNLTETTAKVIYASKEFVILDRTVFYPEGGGQIYDTGTINGNINVINVYNFEGKILHFLDNRNLILNIGQNVICLVDEDRQRQLKCMHTSAHLLNAACYRILGKHIWQAGAYKNTDQSHLDVTHYKAITVKELQNIEKLVNNWIFDGAKVNISELPKDIAERKYGFRLYQGGAIPGNTLRTINIENIDVQACAGLHVSNIKNIGVFKIIKRTSVRDGVERIFYTTNKSAINYIQKQEELLKESSDILSVSKVELSKTLTKFFKEWKEQRKEIDVLNNIISLYEINKIKKIKDKKIVLKIELGNSLILNIFKLIQNLKELEDKTIAIYNYEKRIFIWKGKNSKIQIKDILTELEKKEKCKIKGGGKDLFQGKFY